MTGPLDRTGRGMSESAPLRPAPAWAQAAGLVSLRSRRDREAMPGLDARQAMQEVIHRYCWAFDERRPNLLAECFTEDAVWEASVMGETRVGPFVGQAEVQEWLSRFWSHQRDQRRHLILNFILEDLQDDRGTALAYLLLLGSSDATSRMETSGFYRLSYRREQDGWRIEHLQAGFDSPFWTMDVRDMSPRVRRLFGILDEA
jgi:ketosteroid isomerase-like protein